MPKTDDYKPKYNVNDAISRNSFHPKNNLQGLRDDRKAAIDALKIESALTRPQRMKKTKTTTFRYTYTCTIQCIDGKA